MHLPSKPMGSLTTNNIWHNEKNILAICLFLSPTNRGASLSSCAFIYGVVCVLTGWWALKRMWLFRHWLTTNPIIAVLTPNYSAHLLFVLEGKYRHLCVLCPAEQLGKVMVTTQLLLATDFSTPQLWRWWLEDKKDIDRDMLTCTLTLSSSVFLGMMGDTDSSGPVLWPLTSLTTCREVLYVTPDCKCYLCPLSNPLPVIVRYFYMNTHHAQVQLTLSHLWACSLLCTASTSASPLGKVNRSSWCFLLLSLGA